MSFIQTPFVSINIKPNGAVYTTEIQRTNILTAAGHQSKIQKMVPTRQHHENDPTPVTASGEINGDKLFAQI
jgi:hypothetical protein